MAKTPTDHKIDLLYLRGLAKKIIDAKTLQKEWEAAYQRLTKPGASPACTALDKPTDLRYKDGLIVDRDGCLVYDCTGSDWGFTNETEDKKRLITTLVENQLATTEFHVSVPGAIKNLTVQRLAAACCRLHIDVKYADPAIVEALRVIGAIITAQTADKVTLTAHSKPHSNLTRFTFCVGVNKAPVANYSPIGKSGDVYIWVKMMGITMPIILEKRYTPGDTTAISKAVARRLKTLKAAPAGI